MKLKIVTAKCIQCSKLWSNGYLPWTLEKMRWLKFPTPITNYKSGILKAICFECMLKNKPLS